MESVWSSTVTIDSREILKGSLETEAVVIGAGMAGILTAYRLQDAGIKTIVIEADRIGSGQTRNTTAKITSQHNLIYHHLMENWGKEGAAQYAAMNQQAIEEYHQMIEKNQIDCDFARCSCYLYTCGEKGEELLRKELEAAKALGIDACYVTECELPMTICGALEFKNQAKFHPLKFLKAISGQMEIYEKSPVLRVEGNRVFTEHGDVTGKWIIFAVHFPFTNFPGFYFAKMHQERSYVVSLKQAQEMKGCYLGIDADGLSFRSFQDRILLGGESHKTGNNKSGGNYRRLWWEAERFWPGSEKAEYWSAQDCMTLDKIPYIGRFSGGHDSWFVAAGFGKWGMTSSMVSARIITALITEGSCPEGEIFSPQRHFSGEALKELTANTAAAALHLGKRLFSGADTKVEALEEGQAGVVRWEGRKFGAYKKNGRIYLVSLKCPHLGCQLEWNPEEESWDCPCHGSRFDYMGHLLGNPAQKDTPMCNLHS